MKLPLIIIIFISSCGYGQYPNTRYKGNDVGKIVGWEPDGSTTRIGDTAYRYIHNSWEKQTLVLKSTKKYPDGIWIPVKQFDSTKYYYWKQYLFFKHQSDKQKDIIKKQRNPSYKEYDRLMDSVVRYKKLIDKLNK